MKHRFTMFALVLALLFSRPASAALVWGTDASGELSGSRDETQLVTSGGWDYGFSISWDVTQVDDGWVYSYAIFDGQKDISHFILEVTRDYPAPIVGHNGEFLDPQVWDSAGNLELPEEIFGVKADHGADFYSFFSDRAPVYGNFFAKSGYGLYQNEWTFAHNAGLIDHFSDDILDFIVRPDGDFTPVPEPATMAMLGLGLGALGISRRRRRASAS